MKNKIVITIENMVKEVRLFFLISLFFWFFSFLFRIFFFQEDNLNYIKTEKSYAIEYSIEYRIIEQAKKGNKYEVFILIFKNNIKGCLINILGGVLLGIVTLFNLLINGFYSAHIFYSVYKAGFPISQIVEKTLPHSFEIIGFMLSGALGFYIAWNILLLVKGKNLQVNFYKIIGTGSVIIFIIILCAAYVEAFISIKN